MALPPDGSVVGVKSAKRLRYYMRLRSMPALALFGHERSLFGETELRRSSPALVVDASFFGFWHDDEAERRCKSADPGFPAR